MALKKISILLIAVFAVIFSATSFAYTTYQTTLGPVKLYFGEPGAVRKSAMLTQLSEPFPVNVTLENTANEPVTLDLTFRTIETFELLETDPLERDKLAQTLTLAAGETQTLSVKIVALPGTYSAHYPVHLDATLVNGDKTEAANIVLVVETDVPLIGGVRNPAVGQVLENAEELPLNTVPKRGGLFLPNLDTYRVLWNYDGKESVLLPVGYTGSDKTSAASLHRHGIERGGIYRQAINMHPPYRGGVGNVGAEYRVKLPETTPISLAFFSAIRDVHPPEPSSDGVTFRVLVDGEKVYEHHDAETIWHENSVDLSPFAGKTVLLRLESDPGPKRNTTCDSCYWGDPMIFAGERPEALSAEEKQTLFAENLVAIRSGKSASNRTTVYSLEGGLTAAITFGRYGFTDGVIGLGSADKQVQFDGLRVSCKGQSVSGDFSTIGVSPWISRDAKPESGPPQPKTRLPKAQSKNAANIQFAQDIQLEDRSETLFFGILQNGPAIQFQIDATALDLIDRIEFGPATHSASRVYFGHGYCIEEPEAFTVGSDGHRLSTSHVGMDFDNGLSVLQATSFPPDSFVVDPKTRRYTLRVHPGTTMTLLPGLDGAIDCAVRYRPICGKAAAPGTPEKAGRFVFDIWGGPYREHLKTLETAVSYGMTDAQFIVHDWQRWGYDNRLPDIWPPNPRLGTPEEMRETLDFCDKNGIQYGVHDNYIDFYPDAGEFSFDVTTFHENGQPQKAWNNFGIDAQSYRFRPDRIEKYLDRNLGLILPGLPMSTYFVDVFSSMTPVDFYDREGNFHSRAETQAAWAKSFDIIRDRLDKSSKAVADGTFRSATTSSEGGMDSLIGHLDGADCQFMYIDSEPANFAMQIRCKNWVRVPWFDAVHHTTFSLHGAGYSNRYEAGRGRTLHGIESDDYLVSEILTGHALMVDRGAGVRGAVRKYWLAQDLARHLADKEIVSVEFHKENPDRQIVRWTDGTLVFVNQGAENWNLAEGENRFVDFVGPEPRFLIPQYGFYASTDALNGGIVRHQGRVVEYASFLDDENTTFYVNARQKQSGADGLSPVVPALNSFEYSGANRFTADFAWDAAGDIDKDLCVFVHCTEQRLNWHQKLKEAVLGGGFPKTPTSQWKGKTITDKLAMTVPDDLPAGRYYLVVGLYDQKGDGRRAKLLGFDTGGDRYAVAWMTVQRRGENNSVSNISVETIEWSDTELANRLLPPSEPVDFDFCTTTGAFLVEAKPGETIESFIVTPLPGEPAMEILLETFGEATSVTALDAVGKKLREVPFTVEKTAVRFKTAEGEFQYRITAE